MHERVLEVLELPLLPKKATLRCRVSRISVRGLRFDADSKLAFYVRFQTTEYKCKTTRITAGQRASLEWSDSFKFDCPVGTELNFQLFMIESPSNKEERGKDDKLLKKARGNSTEGMKNIDVVVEDEDAGREWFKKRRLVGVEIGRGRLSLQQADGVPRQDLGKWWPMSSVQKFGCEVDMYLHIETMNHASARKV